MNLNRAQYILTLLEEGSISAAARKLIISQAALSQTVRLVEEEVGLPVLERGRREVKLTYAGERYVETVRQMLLLERSFRNQIDEIRREKSGEFRFGIPLQNGSLVLPPILAKFQKAYPSVRLKITEKGAPQLTALLLQGELDLALVRTAFCEKGLVYQKLQAEQLGLLAGKGSGLFEQYDEGSELEIQQAAKEKFVFMKQGHSSRFSQDKLLEKKKLKLNCILELDSFETAKNVVARIGAVMVVSYSALQRDEEMMARTKFFPLKDASNEENTYLVYHEATYLTPYMKKWMELLREFYERRAK